MPDPEAALATQLRNVEARTGKSLAQMQQIIAASGLARHGEIRSMLMEMLKLGYGDANTVAHLAARAAAPASAADDPLEAIYIGPKAALRPLHARLVAAIDKFGAYETAPKKAYVSLRRKKQFAMIGPATNTRVEVGLNMKDVSATDRLAALPAGQMCQYKVKISDAAEVDQALFDWIRRAFDAAG
jgi:hypothetical protein